MKSQWQKRLFFGVIALGGMAVLLLNILTPMLCDDYRYAFSFATGERITRIGQIFPSLVAHGHVLNGRYAPHFFVQLFTMLPEGCFDIVNTLVFLALLLGLYRLCLDGRAYRPLLVAGIWGALALLPPAFGQNMLWMAGACNYLWPAAALVWLVRPFLRSVSGGEASVPPAAVAAMAAGGLLFGNCSENLSAAGLMLMGLCILVRLFRKQKTPLWMWLTAILTALGWFLLMLSPVEKPTGITGGGMLGVYLERFSHVVSLWLTHLTPLTVAYLVLLCFAWQGGARERILPSLLPAICALCCQLAMVMSSYFPERALLGPVVLMLCACAWLLPCLKPEAQPLRNALCLCLCAFAVLNLLSALPHTYNRSQLAKARNRQVMAAAAAGEKDVTTFGILGRTRYDGYTGLVELSNLPEHFANEAYARYYGLDSIVVDRVE